MTVIYKYCPPNVYSLENLRRHSFYCRHPTDFNDPFEFWCRISSGLPDPEKERDRHREAVRAWGFPDGIPPDADMCREYFESLADSEPDFQLLMDHMRIACFANAPDNLLMWSHYADGMRGFCASFDSDALLRSEKRFYLAAVTYIDSPQYADSFLYAVAEDQHEYHAVCVDEHDRGAGGAISKGERDAYEECSRGAFAEMVAIWRNVFAAKPKQWSYEGEQRLLLHATDGGVQPVYQPFPVEALTGIIIGERMPPDYRQELEELLNLQYPNVPIRRATRSPLRYVIELT